MTKKFGKINEYANFRLELQTGKMWSVLRRRQIAYAVLGRIIPGAHRIELKGNSSRTNMNQLSWHPIFVVIRIGSDTPESGGRCTGIYTISKKQNSDKKWIESCMS